jgi:hypothetical protein
LAGRWGVQNSSLEETPIATSLPIMVADPQIDAYGCGFGRTVHFSLPVSTSSPWITPDRSPMMTVRLVTRALSVTLTLLKVGPTFRGVCHSSWPSRSRA